MRGKWYLYRMSGDTLHTLFSLKIMQVWHLSLLLLMQRKQSAGSCLHFELRSFRLCFTVNGALGKFRAGL